MNPTLLIVTDLGWLKAYDLSHTRLGTPHLEPVEQVVLEPAHRRLGDAVTDLAGRYSAPTMKSWSAPVADDHNLRLERRRRVIRRIADHVQRLLHRREYDACWLAADKEINHQIVDALPGAARARIRKNLSRDLTKVRRRELLTRFLEAAET